MEINFLKKKLRGLHEGSISEEEALEAVANSTPKEISKAEQELLEEGMREPELKEFCKIHLKAIEEKVKDLKEGLPENHTLRILIEEHEKITQFLDELERLSELLEDEGFSPQRKRKLRALAENLVESENHHEREEEVIFPRLKKLGIDGPPRIMEKDHEQFWPKKKRLKELSEEPEENLNEILEIVDFLVFNLRDHIFKENNILYPTALDELEEWDLIQQEGKKIGYCQFVPLSEID
ncbi:MAG: DUF438 domain-containing protein [Candidatus Hadarchaeia archaeon]